MKKLIICLYRLRALRKQGEKKNLKLKKNCKKGICKSILHEVIKNAHKFTWEKFAASSEWRNYSCKIKDYKILVAIHEHPFYGDNEKGWIRNFIFEIAADGDNLVSLEYRLFPVKQIETAVSEGGLSAPWPHLIGLLMVDFLNRAELAVKNQNQI